MPKAPFSLLLASLFAMGAIAGGARAQGTPAAATTPAGGGDRPVASGGTFTPMDPSTELLHSDKARLTRGDYDTQLERLPENTRAGFGTNIDRINTLLRVMLVDKTLAAQARADGLDKDPDLARRIAAETDRLLAQAVIDRDTEKWEKEFDARPNIEEAARERWLAQAGDKYRDPEQIRTTEIVYSLSRHSVDDARRMAEDARKRIQAGGDMTAIAKAESDDPAAATTGGKLDWKSPGDFGDAGLSRAAGLLKDTGQVSRPIVTQDAVVLLRLDAKRPGAMKPFDDVKAAMIRDMRREYVETMRTQKMAAIRDDPSIVVNQPAVDALVVRIDPEFARKALEGAGTPPPGAPVTGRRRPPTQ